MMTHLRNALFLLLFSIPFHASAQTFTLPSTSTTGAFTVTVADAYSWILEEQVGGAWQQAGSGFRSGSINFNRASGTYTFRLFNCNPVANGCSYSSSKSITVTLVGTPTASGSFNKSQINEGQSAIYTWSSTNATSCSATGISGVSGTANSVTYNAPAEPLSNQVISVVLTCTGAGGNSTPVTSNLTVVAVPDAPTLGSISNKTINQDTNTGDISLSISDPDSTSFSLTGSSNNTTLVPNANISFGGSGSARTVRVTPLAGQVGVATITVNVSDGTSTVTKTFTVTVNSTAVFTVPSTDTDGNYTISWSGVNIRQYAQLREFNNSNSQWTTVGSVSGTSGSVTLTRSNGTYTYSLLDCSPYDCRAASNVTEKSTTVSIPVPVVTVTATPNPASESGTSTIGWTSTNATSCSSGSIGGVSGASGNVNYSAPTVMSANQSVVFTITCTGGGGSGSGSVTLPINWVNDTPTLSIASATSINEDTVLLIPFTVSDEETAAANLTWAVTSSDQAKITNANISVDKTNNRLMVTPVANANGTVNLTVKVTDANGAFVQKVVAVTINAVNDAPTISSIANQSINEQQSISLNFNVNDVDSPTLNVTASVTGVLNNSNLVLSGSGSLRNITINPSSGQIGSAVITLQLTDGVIQIPITTQFTVTITDLPAQLFIDSNNGTGTYTLSWKYAIDSIRLKEKRNGEPEVDVFGTEYNPSGTQSFTKTLDGSYVYRLLDCVHSSSQSGTIVTCNETSTKTIAVSVPIPAVPTLTLSTQNSSTGDYTVNWSTTSGTNSYELQENNVTVSNSGNPLWLSKAWTGKSTGVYGYKIRACNAAGCSAFSAVQNVQVAKPAAISGVTASMNQTTGVATLNLSIPTAATKYEIQQRMNAGTWGATQTFTSTTITMPAVNAAGSYSYQARACDTAGSFTSCSAWAASTAVTIAVPVAPTMNNLPGANTTGSFTVSWTTTANTINYVLNEDGIDLPAITATSQSFTSKTNSTYSYKVKSCNAVGCSGYSNIISISDSLSTKYTYDTLGRLIFVEDNVNGNRDYKYDPAGNRTSVSVGQ